MKRTISLVVVALVMAPMLLVMAMPASSAHYLQRLERANAQACQGMVISLLSTSNNLQGPFTPPGAAAYLKYDEVKTYTEGVREGEVSVLLVSGGSFGCDPEDEQARRAGRRLEASDRLRESKGWV